MKDKLINLYKQNIEAVNSGLTEAVNHHRDKAIAKFEQYGIPQKGEENYKYTDMMVAFGRTYAYSFKPLSPDNKQNSLFRCTVPDLDTHTLVLENGWYFDYNNEHVDLPVSVKAMSIREAVKTFPHIVEKYYNSEASKNEDPLAALNTAFAQDGFFLYFPKGTSCEKPVQIINVLRGDNPLMVNQRNLIVAEENSNAKVILCDHTLTLKHFLSNTVTEIFAEDNANIEFYSIQHQNNSSSQIATTFIRQEKNSNVTSNTLTLHGGFVRNNVFVNLAGEYSESHIYGLAIMDNKQHVDNFTFVDHAVPNCKSTELYKNILDDEATGAFSGKILVRKDAQKTEALQSNKNICLTNTAKFFTKPQLEIYADDVKCSHGATIGQIDDEALFYMKARGIGGKEARMMLMFAFAHDVIRNIKVPALVDRYSLLVEQRLRGELSKCEGCVVSC